MLDKSTISETILQLAADVDLDTLLEYQHTAAPTIRFICAMRKALLELTPDQLNAVPSLARCEQLFSRLYEGIGYEQRSMAYTDNSYR